MTLAVRVSSRASADIDEIWLRIARDSVDRADRFVDKLVTHLRTVLSASPFLGRSRDEFGEGLRSLVFQDYVIIYRVRKDAVEVIRILHGRRDLPGLLRG